MNQDEYASRNADAMNKLIAESNEPDELLQKITAMPDIDRAAFYMAMADNLRAWLAS